MAALKEARHRLCQRIRAGISRLNEYGVLSVVQILQQHPTLASEKFECYYEDYYEIISARRAFPLTWLLVSGADKVTFADFKAVYDLNPAACEISRACPHPLEIAFSYGNPDIIKFLFDKNPKVAMGRGIDYFYGQKVERSFIFFLLHRLADLNRFTPRKNPVYQQVLNHILDVIPLETLVAGHKDDDENEGEIDIEGTNRELKSFLNIAVERGLSDCISECLLHRIPKDVDSFHYKTEKWEKKHAKALAAIFPKLKSFTLHFSLFMYMEKADKAMDLLHQELLKNDTIEHLKIQFEHMRRIEPFCKDEDTKLMKKLASMCFDSFSKKNFKVLTISCPTDVYERLKLSEIANIMKRGNKVTCVIVEHCCKLPKPIGQDVEEDLFKVRYYSLMNKQGRASAGDPEVPLSTFVSNLVPLLDKHDSNDEDEDEDDQSKSSADRDNRCPCNDCYNANDDSFMNKAIYNAKKKDEDKRLKECAFYGLLSEAPGLWANAAVSTANASASKRPAKEEDDDDEGDLQGLKELAKRHKITY